MRFTALQIASPFFLYPPPPPSPKKKKSFCKLQLQWLTQLLSRNQTLEKNHHRLRPQNLHLLPNPTPSSSPLITTAVLGGAPPLCFLHSTFSAQCPIANDPSGSLMGQGKKKEERNRKQ